jgi:hypothetical protein
MAKKAMMATRAKGVFQRMLAGRAQGLSSGQVNSGLVSSGGGVKGEGEGPSDARQGL